MNEGNQTLYLQNLNERIKPDGKFNSRFKDPTISTIRLVWYRSRHSGLEAVSHARTGLCSL